MQSQLETIIHNLKECFDGKPWYGISVMEKLNTVPWGAVNDTLYGDKSIAVLVQHIANWRVFILKKLEGDADYKIEMDSENDWTRIEIHTEEEWNALKGQLQVTQDRLLSLLSKETDQILERQVPGKAYTFRIVLTSITQHDSYHLGQIAMLNVMKNS